MAGPLAGVRALEFAGIGPGPFAGCMLADMGADVVRVDRPGPGSPLSSDLMDRGKRSVVADLKSPEGLAAVFALVERADLLIEGYRPGVMERLGLGPDVCLARRPSLVYGRMTGFGQAGPLAGAAGHDINYIALSGALGLIGRAGQPPTPPLNLVGDFGGGGLVLAFGLVCALLEARRSGQGQVVDAAMVDGSGLLLLPFFTPGAASEERGTGLLDSGAPFYDAYETADGKWVSVGAIEPQFYAALLAGLELDPGELPDQHDRASWPALKDRFATIFRARTRDEWCELFSSRDACVAPVLSLAEAIDHPHNQLRSTHVEVAGVVQPAPAPRLSATPGSVRHPAPRIGEHTEEVMAEWAHLDTQSDR